MRVLIIGGTGFMGPHVVAGLDALGHEVAVLHRGTTIAELPAATRHIRCPPCRLGDRGYLAELRDPLDAFAPEVILDMIAVVESDAEAVLTELGHLARRIVVLSSQDVYRAYGLVNGSEDGPTQELPLTEESELRRALYPYRGASSRGADDPHRHLDDYDKILVERAYRSAPGVETVVLRLPMVYGPRDRQHRMSAYLRPMLDARPALLLDRALAGWRVTRGYVADMAAAIVRAVIDREPGDHTYNVGEARALTESEWAATIGGAAGWRGDVRVVSASDGLPHLEPGMRTDQHLVADSSRIREELGYAEVTPRPDALARTVAWERENMPAPPDDLEARYAAEDALLERTD